MKFTKRDLVFSITTGLITGIIAWRIFSYLGVNTILGLSLFSLVFIVPVFWIVGVNLGYFLGRWLAFFNEFGKFVAIGFTNAAVDFGILNLSIYFTGIAGGLHYSLFKGISFTIAIIHSYMWNKFWVFGAEKAGQDAVSVTQFGKFFGVAIVAAIFNILVASLVVNFVTPIAGLDAKAWANIGAVIGSATALILSFVGFRLAVFKKNK